MTKPKMLEISDINEDIASRLLNASKQAASYDELINLSKTKAYTMSRIKRCILNAYLGVAKSDLLLTLMFALSLRTTEELKFCQTLLKKRKHH